MQAAPPDILTQPLHTGGSHRPAGHLATLNNGDLLIVEIIIFELHRIAGLACENQRPRGGRFPWKINLPLPCITSLEGEARTDIGFFQQVLASIQMLGNSHHARGCPPFSLEFIEALTPSRQHIEPVEDYARRAMDVGSDDDYAAMCDDVAFDKAQSPKLGLDQLLTITQPRDLELCMLELRWLRFRVRMD